MKVGGFFSLKEMNFSRVMEQKKHSITFLMTENKEQVTFYLHLALDIYFSFPLELSLVASFYFYCLAFRNGALKKFLRPWKPFTKYLQ